MLGLPFLVGLGMGVGLGLWAVWAAGGCLGLGHLGQGRLGLSLGQDLTGPCCLDGSMLGLGLVQGLSLCGPGLGPEHGPARPAGRAVPS